MRLRVLTWNLFHGRAPSGAGRDLEAEFTAALRRWEWDVAVLQEVPPWWPARLAGALGCEWRAQPTSRNALGVAGRWGGVHHPDLIKSWAGGANAVLCRGDRIAATRSLRLRRWPERRWALGVELGCGAWVVTLHASQHARAAGDVARAGAAARAWSAGSPVVLAGDLNLHAGSVDVAGFQVIGSCDVDHVLCGGGAAAAGPIAVPTRDGLSDHAPLAVTIALA